MAQPAAAVRAFARSAEAQAEGATPEAMSAILVFLGACLPTLPGPNTVKLDAGPYSKPVDEDPGPQNDNDGECPPDGDDGEDTDTSPQE